MLQSDDDAAALGRRAARDQPADHLLGPDDLPGRRRRSPTSATNDVTINVFGGGVFSDVFVAEGIWNEDQVDPSYDGSAGPVHRRGRQDRPAGLRLRRAVLVRERVQGLGQAASPTSCSHDAGFEVYSQTLAIRPTTSSRSCAPCLEQFVPIVQQAAIDYVDDPAAANDDHRRRRHAVRHVLDLHASTSPSTRSKTQKELGLVGNGPDDTLGNMDEARIQGVIDQIRDAGLDVPEDLVASRPVHQRVHRSRASGMP